MAVKRYRRKRVVPRRKRFYRRRRKMILTKSMVKKVHGFTRWANPQTAYLVAGSSSATFARTFTLDDCNNYGEFQALYDQYKLCGVLAVIQLINNPDATTYLETTNPNTANIYPKLWYLNDHDDESTISLANIRERASVKCRILRPNVPIKFFMKPAVLSQMYGTTLTTGYAPKWGQFIDIGNAAVKHYCFKGVIESLGNNAANTYGVRIEYKYYLQMKDPR